MKTSLFKAAVTPFLPIFAFYFLTEDGLQTKILANLQSWNENNPQEKVFVQVNRTQFAAGEQIWLKAWCTFKDKPSFLSRILYIDITNEAGIVVDKKMFKIDSSGTVNTGIEISKKLTTGNYSLNAYTLWMLNYPSYIFKKSLYVYGEDYVKKISKRETPGFEVFFFPEGGQLISGVKNKIAFSVLSNIGIPVDIKGKIIDQSGKELMQVNTLHNGMGVIEMDMINGEKYALEIALSNGSTRKFKLPDHQSEGIHLNIINQNANRLFATVLRSEQNKSKYSKLLLVAHMSGQPVFSGYFNFDEDITTIPINKKKLPAGIMQITVFDTTGTPLAERITFIENYNILLSNIQSVEKNMGKRGKNEFSIHIDSVKNPFISVLVNDAGVESQDMSDNIASSLLLTSEINGYVHEAGYYFKDKSPETLTHLDLVMMVNGWRKFTWKQIIANEPTNLKFPIESNLNIKGYVTKSDRNEVIKEGKVSFFIKGDDSTKILADAFLTDKGEFIVDSIDFYKKAKVFYSGTNNKKENLVVDVHFYKAYIDTLIKSRNSSRLNLDTIELANRKNKLSELLYGNLASNMDSLTGVKDLGNVTVTTKKISKEDSLQREYVSTFFELSDQTLVIPDNRSFVNIWQFLNIEIPGFNVNPFAPGGVTAVSFARNQGLNISGQADESGAVQLGLDAQIKFFLNEMPVDIDFVNALDPNDVALVKVYKGALAFPFGSDGGAIAIYTKKGYSPRVNQKSFVFVDRIGYELKKEFYHVDYGRYPLLNKNKTDKRSTLYWNPAVKLDKNGNMNFSFYNSDITTNFKIIIQGLDANGKIIFSEKTIN